MASLVWSLKERWSDDELGVEPVWVQGGLKPPTPETPLEAKGRRRRERKGERRRGSMRKEPPLCWSWLCHCSLVEMYMKSNKCPVDGRVQLPGREPSRFPRFPFLVPTQKRETDREMPETGRKRRKPPGFPFPDFTGKLLPDGKLNPAHRRGAWHGKHMRFSSVFLSS